LAKPGDVKADGFRADFATILEFRADHIS